MSVAAADVDGDGDVDIIVGNFNQQETNQLLLNNGDGSYNEVAIDLPGRAMSTTSVAVADVDGDGDVDIIVGNLRQNNQLLLNDGDGNYSDPPITLPGGTMDTLSITTGDVDRDGDVDIIVGNLRQNNQLLLNNGDGSYSEEVMDLPGGARSTRSVAAADVDGDGMVDIIIGNSSNEENQLLINESAGSSYSKKFKPRVVNNKEKSHMLCVVEETYMKCKLEKIAYVPVQSSRSGGKNWNSDKYAELLLGSITSTDGIRQSKLVVDAEFVEAESVDAKELVEIKVDAASGDSYGNYDGYYCDGHGCKRERSRGRYYRRYNSGYGRVYDINRGGDKGYSRGDNR